MQPTRSIPGKVILVGAGPGDPGLITVRGRELIMQADVIVYDHLVNEDLIHLAPESTRKIYVGKLAGKHILHQDEINRLLVQEARSGALVVRLKGGDPFVFGRGAEECDYLYEQGIEFSVVPGVSAVSAVPAYAGIPLTHRDCSPSFVAVTGHEHSCKEESGVDWSIYAHVPGTLVVFMGILHIDRIVSGLLQYGKPSDTPVAVIRWGTYPHQQTITGTLATIVEQVKKANLRPPGLIVIGEVVRFHERLRWFETLHPENTDSTRNT